MLYRFQMDVEAGDDFDLDDASQEDLDALGRTLSEVISVFIARTIVQSHGGTDGLMGIIDCHFEILVDEEKVNPYTVDFTEGGFEA